MEGLVPTWIHKDSGHLGGHGMIQVDFDVSKRWILIRINRKGEEVEGETSLVFLEDVLRHLSGECEFRQGCRTVSNELDQMVDDRGHEFQTPSRTPCS